MSFCGTLRPFQQEAFEKMIARKRVLVGYEMGLGKTVLSIATVEHLLDNGLVCGGLIIVPSSLKYQWAKEIRKFTNGEAVVKVVDGDRSIRERTYKEIQNGGVEYAILNYEQVVNDWQIVRHLPRDYVILDEATMIKNFAAKRSRRVKRLAAPYRYALTGQPVENRPEEVFSMMQWVDKAVLGDFETFDTTFIKRNPYGRVKYYRNLPMLHELLSEAMVRKTRSDPDVAPYMPKVVEEVIEVEFDRAGASLYRYIAADLRAELAAAMNSFSTFDLWSHYNGEQSAAAAAAQGRIMSRLTCLRMLCDHPDLLKISAGLKAQGALTGMKGGSVYAAELAEAGRLEAVKASPKIQLVVEEVKFLLEANPKNKVVVFAFFKELLRILQRETEGITGSVLFNGDMNSKQKDAAKEKFQTDPNVRLFLSSDAGGYGVDLPNANYLISVDLPWSAGKLDQRNARIIRLSSEFESVTLLYFLMRGSIEEWQFDMLTEKRLIASAVVDGKGYDKKTGRLNLTLATLTEFLETSDV